MGNLTVPMKNVINVEKTEAKVYLEHRDSAFAYLDKRKAEGKSQHRITMQEIIEHTEVEQMWEASTIYREWLRNLGQEKWNE